AESAVFVQRGLHGADVSPSQPGSQTFADVALSEWYADWAQALWDDGYTTGCGVDPLRYCPLQGHTRAEGAVFYLRMLYGVSYQPPAPQGLFDDVSTDAWYADWVEAAYDAGLIEPCGQNPLRYCPNAPLTRATAAYMLVQAKGLLP
ncbi:MAG TPA: S-layer homology domain-containing protein, partial [Anaerolineales bacterium]